MSAEIRNKAREGTSFKDGYQTAAFNGMELS